MTLKIEILQYLVALAIILARDMYEKDFMVIFAQCSKLSLGLDVQSEIQILI